MIAYRDWFHAVMPERIDQLKSLVRSTSGFEEWEPDESVGSLEALGRWFEGQVQTRPLTEFERAQTEKTLTFPIEIPQNDLTDRTFSLAIDLGMYFGRVILRNLPGTTWSQPLRSKNFVDYGHPVIMGFGNVPLNPVGIMVTTAYKVSDGKPARLREVFDRWATLRK